MTVLWQNWCSFPYKIDVLTKPGFSKFTHSNYFAIKIMRKSWNYALNWKVWCYWSQLNQIVLLMTIVFPGGADKVVEIINLYPVSDRQNLHPLGPADQWPRIHFWWPIIIWLNSAHQELQNKTKQSIIAQFWRLQCFLSLCNELKPIFYQSGPLI